jgi:photoactive yellow protein
VFAAQLQLFSRLVDTLPVGVIVLDHEGKAVIYNRVEEQLSGRRREVVLGSDFFRAHAYCMNVPAIAGRFREDIGRRALQTEADFSFPFPFLATPREVRVTLTDFEANNQPYGLLLIRDVSHERSVAMMRTTLNEMVVHDLKNPLAALAANLDYLHRSIRDQRDALEAVTDSLESVKRISAMVTNLLETSRLETNSFPLRRSNIDLRALCANAIALERAVARSREVQLELVGPPDPVLVEADSELMLRVLENLLDNSIRYATRITVSVRQVDEQTLLEVGDNGPGIPPEERTRIFEKYRQVSSGAPHTRGLHHGVGLHFVQQAARAHGGDAEVQDAPAGGALFRVRLPTHPTSVLLTP